MSSLERLGQFANLRISSVTQRTKDTLEWLFTSGATFDPGLPSATLTDNAPITLGAWLSHGYGIFWITGLPGSGKSTAMRHVFESPKTLSLLEAQPTSQPDSRSEPEETHGSLSLNSYHESIWTRIGLFITIFEGYPEQSKWETMLHGLLLQLLRSRPDLIHPMKQFARDIERQQRHLGKNIGKPHCEIDWSDVKWSNSLVQQALEHCVKAARRPLKILVIIDGMDELEATEIAYEAALFLNKLAENNTKPSTFRICVASRPEQHLLKAFMGAPRIEMHHHTREDIRRHASSVLCRNFHFKNMPEEKVQASLKPLLDYIVENAAGVFLWAHSIALLADGELRDCNPIEGLHHRMEKLPNTMGALYQRLLERVTPNLRLRAYIALEVVLRLGLPTLETVFHAVQATELWLEERGGKARCIDNRRNFRKDIAMADLQRFRGQLLVSCRCMLRFHAPIPCKHGRVHRRVSLVHASAREYLLRLDFQGVLFPQDGPERPIGNGHGYRLLHARSWLKSLTRPEDDWDMKCMEIVLEQAPKLERTMKARDLKVFFEILDDMDNVASTLFGAQWLSCRSPGDSHDEIRFPSFLAWAITAGMHEYVIHRVGQQDNPKDFINIRSNGHETCPLLHFTSGKTTGGLANGIRLVSLRDDSTQSRHAISNFKPPIQFFRETTFIYLIEGGADINAIFRGRTALQYDGEGSQWQPHLRMVQFLLDHGADPNISVTSYLWIENQLRRTAFPLLHIAVYWEASKFGTRLDVAAALRQHGAKLNTPDEGGCFLSERLYYADFHFSPSRWAWVLENGAKITESMVMKPDETRAQELASDTFTFVGPSMSALKYYAGICYNVGLERPHQVARDILRQPSFRRREWYTEEAAELAEKIEPGWFAVGEKYQAGASRVLAGEDVED
ncbi:hypothetical protein B0T11DRAFT_98142 [Plectosphaerella cucumerina]|uniref:Nephrocystin 3-like N-terminal domain-containing protein n=1 Tax=Plectosphaerella cucumerina TaxID=40658 RepID=A0A8K0T7W5_9PEZI|nr:hypothetical protein B0T11DRAFT_98142 [Plectosphaerella cucumerina]